MAERHHYRNIYGKGNINNETMTEDVPILEIDGSFPSCCSIPPDIPPGIYGNK
jgi:hypothetical protein